MDKFEYNFLLKSFVQVCCLEDKFTLKICMFYF